MEVKFVWATCGINKNEVCDLTMKVENVPRVGELVHLEVKIGTDEWVSRYGRVKDIAWRITGECQKATVILGA